MKPMTDEQYAAWPKKRARLMLIVHALLAFSLFCFAMAAVMAVFS
jgi:hypothetical protein